MRSFLVTDQRPLNYGPRRNFVVDEKIYLRKFVALVEYSMPRAETITLRKTSGPRHVLYYVVWPSDKKVWRPWARSFPVDHINLSRKAEKQCKF